MSSRRDRCPDTSSPTRFIYSFSPSTSIALCAHLQLASYTLSSLLVFRPWGRFCEFSIIFIPRNFSFRGRRFSCLLFGGVDKATYVCMYVRGAKDSISYTKALESPLSHTISNLFASCLCSSQNKLIEADFLFSSEDLTQCTTPIYEISHTT